MSNKVASLYWECNGPDVKIYAYLKHISRKFLFDIASPVRRENESGFCVHHGNPDLSTTVRENQIRSFIKIAQDTFERAGLPVQVELEFIPGQIKYC